MAITGIDDIARGLAASRALNFSKNSLAAQVAGNPTSLWRAAGFPGQGAIPAGAEPCFRETAGAILTPLATVQQYVARAEVFAANASTVLTLHDRLAHMGGLVGNVTTAQTVDLNLETIDPGMSNRIGADDYSEVMWWLEWYTATGSTSVTATISGLNFEDTPCTATLTLPVSMGASRAYPIPLPDLGTPFKVIDTVQLSASTGTAGNFGVTATRCLCGIATGAANSGSVYDWQQTRLASFTDQTCLTLMAQGSTTSSGNVNGSFTLIDV